MDAYLRPAIDSKIYKYPFFVEIGYNPEKIAADRLFQHLPDYKELKFQNLPRERAAKFRRIIEDIGIRDYLLIQDGRHINMYFRHEDDRSATKAALTPHSPQMARLVSCVPATSNRALRNIRDELKEEFKKTATGTKAKFIIDRKNKTISVRTSNGADFVQFLKDYARMREDGPVKPSLIDPPARKAANGTFSERYARAVTSTAREFDAAALPPDMDFDISYSRKSLPLPPSRRLPEHERIRRDYHYNYYWQGKPDKAHGPS